MGKIFYLLILALFVLLLVSCPNHISGMGSLGSDVDIVLLHHSTGGNVWGGGVPALIGQYNEDNEVNYSITERSYPTTAYGVWANYPYDYWDIWVNNRDTQPYKNQDNLPELVSQYDVIIWKHCFPVSGLAADSGSPDISSSTKSAENYKLQYAALKTEMRKYPETRFIVWTGAALVAASSSTAQGQRARDFFTWVKDVWDTPGDNIFVWDFFELETEGGNFLLNQYAASSSDSHPNATFCESVAPYLVNRIADVIKGAGDTRPSTGKP